MFFDDINFYSSPVLQICIIVQLGIKTRKKAKYDLQRAQKN